MAGALANQTQGRVIHINFDVVLTPPGHPVSWSELGDTDAATEIGIGLVREAAAMIKTAGEAEGYVVKITARGVFY